MNKNILLLFMIFCYLLPIYYVYYYYNYNNSISNIICNNNYKYNILFFMLLMGIGSLLYELERNDNYSIILICLIFIGIYGLVCINETNIIHYMYVYFLSFYFYFMFYDSTLLFEKI
jgi:hypothetical protein